MRKIINDALREYSHHRAGLIRFLRFFTYQLYNTDAIRKWAIADIKRNNATIGPILKSKKGSDIGDIVWVISLNTGREYVKERVKSLLNINIKAPWIK